MNLYPQAEIFLNEVGLRLNAITPEQFEAPDEDAPSTGEFVGFATDYQRALYTLLANTEAEHDAVHERMGLEKGAHKNLSLEHQKLHAVLNIANQLYVEDLTQTFGSGDAWTSCVDRDWRVYRVEDDLSDDIALSDGEMRNIIVNESGVRLTVRDAKDNTCVYVTLSNGRLSLAGGSSIVEEILGEGMREKVRD